MADKIEKNVNGMVSQTVSAFEKQRDDSIKAIQGLATKGSGISKTEMEKMVKNVNDGYDKRINQEQDDQSQINKILENASFHHRNLTSEESTTIDKLKSDMYSKGVQSLSKNQVEEQAIYDNMRINHTATSAQEAANIVKNSKSATDNVISDANNTYNQKVAAIIRERDETHTISSDEADKLIKAAGKERDDTVKAAEDKHKKVVDEAKKQSGDLVNDVDWQNGTVKSKWTVFWQDVGKKTGEGWGALKKGAKGWWDYAVKGTSDWWENDIAPWFTKEKWQGLATQAINAITAPFKNIQWPKISTPHISWEPGGWQSTGWIYNVLSALHLPTQMPKLQVDWYANGGIFDTPTIAGLGEAGTEASLPLNDKVFSQIARGIVENSDSNDSGVNTDKIIDRLDNLESAIKGMKIVLQADNRKLAESVNKGNRSISRRYSTST